MKFKITLVVETEIAGEEAPPEELKESLADAFLQGTPNIINVNDNCDIIVNSIEIDTECYDR